MASWEHRHGKHRVTVIDHSHACHASPMLSSKIDAEVSRRGASNRLVCLQDVPTAGTRNRLSPSKEKAISRPQMPGRRL